MLRFFVYCFLFLSPFFGLAQAEKVWLHVDKRYCYPNDTIWFRAYISGNSHTNPSSNLYVELFNDSSQLISRKQYPVVKGVSFGQLELPDTSGFYWIRAYTLGCVAEAIEPITLSTGSRPLVTRSYLSPTPGVSPENIISLSKTDSGYVIRVNDTVGFNYSLSVERYTDLPSVSMRSFPFTQPPVADTSFWTLKAKVVTERGKPLTAGKHDLVAIFQQDTVVNPPWVVPIDSTGYVQLNNLYFFGNAFLRYKLNHVSKNSRNKVLLRPVSDNYPVFKRPAVAFYYLDTLIENVLTDTTAFNKPGYLKTVTVKGRWIDRHRSLNKKYVQSEDFEPIEHYTYDLRDSAYLRKYYSVRDFFIGGKVGDKIVSEPEVPLRWQNRTISPMGSREPCKGVEYYIDEKLVSAEIAESKPLRDFAYAKLYQDRHPPCPCVCLWTRKGEDLEALPGQMNRLSIKGYDTSLTWTTPDSITWLWNPYIDTNDFTFSAPAKRFKITIVGVTASGKPFTFEKRFY